MLQISKLLEQDTAAIMYTSRQDEQTFRKTQGSGFKIMMQCSAVQVSDKSPVETQTITKSPSQQQNLPCVNSCRSDQ
jgi:hypothetical protein